MGWLLMGRMATLKVPPTPGGPEKPRGPQKPVGRRLAASVGLGRTYDRVCRRLGRTRSVGAAATIGERLVPLGGGDVAHWWRLLFPIASFVVGMGVLLLAAISGHPALIAVGLIMSGLGPAGLIGYLHGDAPPEPPPAVRTHEADTLGWTSPRVPDSPFPMPQMTTRDARGPAPVRAQEELRRSMEASQAARAEDREIQLARAMDARRPLPDAVFVPDEHGAAGGWWQSPPLLTHSEVITDPWAALGHPGTPPGARELPAPGGLPVAESVDPFAEFPSLIERLEKVGEHELASLLRVRYRDRPNAA